MFRTLWKRNHWWQPKRLQILNFGMKSSVSNKQNVFEFQTSVYLIHSVLTCELIREICLWNHLWLLIICAIFWWDVSCFCPQSADLGFGRTLWSISLSLIWRWTKPSAPVWLLQLWLSVLFPVIFWWLLALLLLCMLLIWRVHSAKKVVPFSEANGLWGKYRKQY